ncbi:PREDICTED: transcription factor AP-1-like [Amphimedon queenslandica]|uniref:BZIP domain-containing protein n=1 Tax=Amphimedon queenslandica TaxID=400682 RepID=A0A1X7U248_AMPQE|nr:PREDICTED: transcription factor AP-1-like [Amphimedon queenslandica]|eukprot:XP_003389192.2 PREDICTED: transcription factor AP-1-like [Amphimedon queenslandica]
MMALLQEHSLYDDNTPSVSSTSSSSSGVLPYEKQIPVGVGSNMYLDLKSQKHQVLSTPDVSVFALSTPEVHNLLSSSTSTSVTSSLHRSPSRHYPTHPGHPITMEQEYYAKGFLDRFEALQAGDVHKPLHPSHTTLSDNSMYSSYAPGSNPSLEAVAPTYVTATLDHIPNFSMTTQTTSESTTSYPVSSQHDVYYSDAYSLPSYPRHEGALMGGFPMMASAGGVAVSAQPMYSVMEPHVVGHDVLKEMSMVPDLQTQEQMKVERKKARNRIAASKCRTRRLQRESDLESKVKILKDHNKELNDEVSGLKKQISSLKKALSQHASTGCQINISPSSLPGHSGSNA